ncbi:head GIN domain-containing protein [Mucilaginibacter lacusdianchii]|uniref:head GIN domain-containing protein n=1 Tax=Mucilaginibacter lacusdianchii TaxID=2684211 RepID=UPI00131D936F|nr:head GIN domain-containing protein [Mucilaginibacter sp. JXJ CY 39]
MQSLTKLLLVAALITGAGETYAKPTPVNKAFVLDEQDRHLSGFHAVSVSGSFDVYITQGGSESVKVEADNDVIDRIITEVKGGELKIYTKSSSGWNFNWGNKKRVVHVMVKDINSITLAGSGDVIFKDGLRANSLVLSLSGSGDISGSVDVKDLQSKIVGSGDITVSGRAQSSEVSVSGSGDFTGRNLVTENTAVKVVGSGDARVNANQQLSASITGSGDVHYTGAVKRVSTTKTGSGGISRE